MLTRLGRGAIRGLDALVRRGYGVYEFSADSDCILRLARSTCGQEVALSDGTRICAGEPIGELHLWNEQLPSMPAAGPDVRWAVVMRRRLAHSLQLLASHVAQSPSWDGVRAFRGRTALDPGWSGEAGTAVLAQLGLELEAPDPIRTDLQRFTDFWENLYTWWIIWTYAPPSLRGKRFTEMQRRRVWLSRSTLMQKYSGNAQAFSTRVLQDRRLYNNMYR